MVDDRVRPVAHAHRLGTVGHARFDDAGGRQAAQAGAQNRAACFLHPALQYNGPARDLVAAPLDSGRTTGGSSARRSDGPRRPTDSRHFATRAGTTLDRSAAPRARLKFGLLEKVRLLMARPNIAEKGCDRLILQDLSRVISHKVAAMIFACGEVSLCLTRIIRSMSRKRKNSRKRSSATSRERWS